MKQQHVAFISHGKDSIAMLEAIKQLGLPLDRIISIDIWATPTIRGELPEMVKFKEKADKIIFERYGIAVEHLRAEKSFEEYFYQIRNSKVFGDGTLYGFPCQKSPWCNTQLKINVMRPIKRQKPIEYIGIAADEVKRAKKHDGNPNIVLPLVLAGWTEQYCFDFCKQNGLLSPSYDSSFRDGCWFCPNQPLGELRWLRKTYPDYWQFLLKWDKDSPVTFKMNNKKVADYERRFQAEDDGLIDVNKPFKWAMLDEPIQIMLGEEYQ